VTAARARRLLVFSHPPRTVASRIHMRAEPGLRLARKEFRMYAHPPAAMLDGFRANGLRATHAHPGVLGRSKGSAAERGLGGAQRRAHCAELGRLAAGVLVR
jgi:magnesium-protoporphyrin O-methyltransferase